MIFGYPGFSRVNWWRACASRDFKRRALSCASAAFRRVFPFIRFMTRGSTSSTTKGLKSPSDLKRLGEKIHKAKTVSRVDESKGEWEALLLDDVTGDELLAVTRNLTCSEKGAFKYNQTLNTTWNCLISRRIFGVENKSPSFLEVNGVNVSPIFSD